MQLARVRSLWCVTTSAAASKHPLGAPSDTGAHTHTPTHTITVVIHGMDSRLPAPIVAATESVCMCMCEGQTHVHARVAHARRATSSLRCLASSMTVKRITLAQW